MAFHRPENEQRPPTAGSQPPVTGLSSSQASPAFTWMMISPRRSPALVKNPCGTDGEAPKRRFGGQVRSRYETTGFIRGGRDGWMPGNPIQSQPNHNFPLRLTSDLNHTIRRIRRGEGPVPLFGGRLTPEVDGYNRPISQGECAS